MNRKLRWLVNSIRRDTCNAHGLLAPLSGGSDSSLFFVAANLACPEKTVGVHVGSNLRGGDWLRSIGKVREYPRLEGLGTQEDLRWALINSICRSESLWPVGTRNRTEDVFGTYSIASRIATYLPLVGLWKTEVMELCEIAGIPHEITDSSRRADPDCGRPVEMAEIPLELVDTFLKVKVKELSRSKLKALSRQQIDYLEKIYRYNRFKAQLPVRGPRPPWAST